MEYRPADAVGSWPYYSCHRVDTPAFLALLGRIGADRAGYVTVAIPIVVLLFSALFEGLRWHISLVLGILLCLAGNVAVLWGRRTPQL